MLIEINDLKLPHYSEAPKAFLEYMQTIAFDEPQERKESGNFLIPQTYTTEPYVQTGNCYATYAELDAWIMQLRGIDLKGFTDMEITQEAEPSADVATVRITYKLSTYTE